MYVYVPTKVAERPAVVVALHGCTQSAKDYVNAGWNDLAEAWGFYVVYPEQQMANNMNRCFNWYEGAEIKRAGGEPTSIVQMVDKAKATYGATRAFVTGLSAGAAMTAVMLATYPDVFEAGSIDAGLPYACATSMTQAYTCMGGNTKKTADAWGDLVRQAFAGAAAPRVQIWQGSADYTVRPGNLTELGKQWTNVAGTDDKADETTSVGPATRKRYKNATGTTLVETFEIPNMGHGTAIKSQGEGGVACGKPGAYILESGICSTYHAGTFFGLQP
jgi:poly(hydroxyalkanoate) depolymerase family esterase